MRRGTIQGHHEVLRLVIDAWQHLELLRYWQVVASCSNFHLTSAGYSGPAPVRVLDTQPQTENYEVPLTVKLSSRQFFYYLS